MAALATIFDIGTQSYEHVSCPAVSHQVSGQSGLWLGGIRHLKILRWLPQRPGLEVTKLEFILRLLSLSASSRSLRFILSLRINSRFITSKPA